MSIKKKKCVKFCTYPIELRFFYHKNCFIQKCSLGLKSIWKDFGQDSKANFNR